MRSRGASPPGNNNNNLAWGERELEDEAAAAAYDAYESALARRELEDGEAAVAAYGVYESGRSELVELPGDGAGDEDDVDNASGPMGDRLTESDGGGEPAGAVVATRDGSDGAGGGAGGAADPIT